MEPYLPKALEGSRLRAARHGRSYAGCCTFTSDVRGSLSELKLDAVKMPLRLLDTDWEVAYDQFVLSGNKNTTETYRPQKAGETVLLWTRIPGHFLP